VSPGLELTVDYGILTVLAKPIFWLLKTLHKLVGNWGWSIILLTMMIKLAFYKLSETSYRSMAKMRNVQPRMKALQERYADDRQKLSQAMMELYKREKVNPAAGCLPILVQMPFFNVQPRPMADTTNPCFPSWRCSIGVPPLLVSFSIVRRFLERRMHRQIVVETLLCYSAGDSQLVVKTSMYSF